ncbi:hypothetical protein EAP62_27585 [Salmonella enterica]|nr:hypothetical protein [Salmonella enterica]
MGVVAGAADSGVVAGAADSGVVAGAADSGVVAGAADSGVVAGAADSGVVAGAVFPLYLIRRMFHAGKFAYHFVGYSRFSLNEFGAVQESAVHLIDQPACIVVTFIGDQCVMHIGICAALREFIQKPAVALATGVPGFYL